MSKGSARRPGAIPDDEWERIVNVPVDPGITVIVDADEDDEDDIPAAPLEPMSNGEGGGP